MPSARYIARSSLTFTEAHCLVAAQKALKIAMSSQTCYASNETRLTVLCLIGLADELADLPGSPLLCQQVSGK
jgi:hypothetical protein